MRQAPSFFFAIPNATPIANKIPNCSNMVEPALEKNFATVGNSPIAVSALPIPTIIAEVILLPVASMTYLSVERN